MRPRFAPAVLLLALGAGPAASPQQPEPGTISPARPIPTGRATHMQYKLVKDTPEEKVYAVIFYKGDEVLSGLTDFAAAQKITDAHFTGIGAVSTAEVGWLDLGRKAYRGIEVPQQVEVLSLIGDVATYNSKPVVHMHAVLGKPDGSTVGGHVWQLTANPTIEVFLTANAVPLKKRPDDPSGMKLIDPAQ